ncbi:hypothetical protein N0V93_000660 [Gnomoniopsis smithogilvyi]|uniref:C2 domain-containing protein n=1 Tax=Gnomoniopsis smithogilvyi TaxID=1191159 RepID=A0A9W9D1Y9_9PEZI|nr:hypothetical protein N0V93_000660 [Gnomoniopsis smithogilvyi]
MVKSHLVNGPHSAGIFADMSLDGPVIGTLVVIVDRAKNLPNRKTIGKQDPYCAGRLGKEAKKTTTDIRGGQTPKWDQELRFTVHDAPDYYQLKLSVFNDDKKTELIGEAWIDLRDIIVSGGGQSDQWQGLTCKGKYAGDIRIEITFYDSRPKPDKPVAKPKAATSDNDLRQQKVPKRRPLPSDPYTGQAPPPPAQPAPKQHSNPPREHFPEQSIPDYAQGPHGTSQSNSSVSFSMDHIPSQSGQYGTPPSIRGRHAENYDPYPDSTYQTPPSRVETRASLDRERPVFQEDGSYSPDHHGHTPDRRYTPNAPYGSSTDLSFMPALDDDRPPPPPVHRITPGGTPEAKHMPGLLHQSQTPPIMRKDVLRNEAHRQSVPSSNAYPGRPVYRAYDSAPSQNPPSNDSYVNGGQQVVAPRHHSYDPTYDHHHHRSMQPTVEDVPDSPGSGLVDDYRRASRAPPYEADRGLDPTPPPLNVGGRNSAPAGSYQASHRTSASPDYARSDHLMEYGGPGASHTPYEMLGSYSSARTGHEHELPDTQVSVPAALIPGIDPTLSMELSQRVNEVGRHERRHTQPASQLALAGSARGRQMVDRPPSYSAPPEAQFNVAPHNLEAYERNPVPFYAGPPSTQRPTHSNASPGHSPGRVARNASPGQSPGRSTNVRRKSVSPAPIIQERRLSAVPFGPDDYNALNPTLAVPKQPTADEPSAGRIDYDEINGMIITHDGREVDPSDHLPMESWAPEPEPKKPTSSTTSRPTPSGPQPPPPSGRKALRIRERPVSSLPPASYISSDPSLPPPTSGRNRLQKKAVHRNSAMPVMMSGANGLAPASPGGDFAPRSLGRASTMDFENHAPVALPGMREHSMSAPPVPAKIPVTASGAMVSYGGGGDSLMEEMSRIDIGTGRARRHTQRPAIGGY